MSAIKKASIQMIQITTENEKEFNYPSLIWTINSKKRKLKRNSPISSPSITITPRPISTIGTLLNLSYHCLKLQSSTTEFRNRVI